MRTSIQSRSEPDSGATLFQIAAHLNETELPKVFQQSVAERMHTLLQAPPAKSGGSKKSVAGRNDSQRGLKIKGVE